MVACGEWRNRGWVLLPPSSVHHSIRFSLILLCLPCLRKTELGEERLEIGDIRPGLEFGGRRCNSGEHAASRRKGGR